MKTAISLPDELFKNAEKLANKLRMSRSELFQKAIKIFIEENESRDVTQKLNAIYSEENSNLDPVLKKIQSATILKNSNESW